MYDLYPSASSATLDTRSYNFPDGDLSLLVESTSFRVHRDKLVRHSHVFDDMFIVAHPDSEDEEEAYQQTQAVSVRMPDTVEEWRLVFSVLYPPKDRASSSSIASLRDVAVALRMAEKYDVADVHAWAVAHFTHRYPLSLSYISDGDTLLEPACFALNLAKMYGISQVLPSILFALATTEWHLSPSELGERLSPWLDTKDIEKILAGRNILWKRTLIARHEAEPRQSSPMLEPYCAAPGPAGLILGPTYSRATKSCRDILGERLREALGLDSRTRLSGARGVKDAPGRTLLDALQILEEMDDLDIVVWPSPVCHVCSLVHSRWVTQTKARTIRDMLEAFQD
ncbi:unnamed protein product [Rhizoctonia solani]|uniref:BTB domain-containing protein n=3 Tax=Rhizoctonia solani TaxID=456999 RepID=A0A8H3HM54_9AGAM|nr:BTB/POZ domain protein [Rhizoctonia solani AG-3 Rhs1AP]KEP52474.1 BTB/POZ domain protein [Rhizoctonia solani 123E]CAE6443501.1 unnamed protein product [Rhizoctonia solani]CAE6521855.1 unnamed protein product [Rhizoctonia solani]